MRKDFVLKILDSGRRMGPKKKLVHGKVRNGVEKEGTALLDVIIMTDTSSNDVKEVRTTPTAIA